MSKTCSFLIFEAPLPPSQNACNIPVKSGNSTSISKSKKFRTYKKMFLEQIWLSIRMKGKYDFTGQLVFWTVVFPIRNGSDVDNYNKCIQDCLEAAGAFKNDNQIVGNRQERGHRVKEGMIRCYLAKEKHRTALSSAYEGDLKAISHLREGPILTRRHASFLIQPQHG